MSNCSTPEGKNSAQPEIGFVKHDTTSWLTYILFLFVQESLIVSSGLSISTNPDGQSPWVGGVPISISTLVLTEHALLLVLPDDGVVYPSGQGVQAVTPVVLL